MEPGTLIGVLGTLVSVAGVAVGYLQYRHAKEEARHLRKLVDHAERPVRVEPVVVAAPEVPQRVVEAVPVPAPPAPPAVPAIPAAMPPVPKSRTAALEAALIVARGLSSPYERDKKRAEVFEEAVRRRQYPFAAHIIGEYENTYDRERCKERMAQALLTVKDPEVAHEVTETMRSLGR
jgi:hypothetical protein